MWALDDDPDAHVGHMTIKLKKIDSLCESFKNISVAMWTCGFMLLFEVFGVCEVRRSDCMLTEPTFQGERTTQFKLPRNATGWAFENNSMIYWSCRPLHLGEIFGSDWSSSWCSRPRH